MSAKNAHAERHNLSLKRVVDALRPRDREYFVWDVHLPRFGCRVSPAGHKRFVVQYRALGITRRVTLGDVRTLPPAAAYALALETLGRVAGGDDPQTERRQAVGAAAAEAKACAASLSVDAIADRYLETLRLTSKSTNAKWPTEARRLYDNHIKPTLGARAVASLTTPDVRQIHQRMHATPALANRTRAVLSAILTRATGDGARPAGSNPCEPVAPYDEPPRDRYLSADEWRRLATALAAERLALADVPRWDTRPVQLDAVVCLFLTGARKEAITRRRWADVDWEGHALKVEPAHKGVSRIVLGAPALAALGCWHAERVKHAPYIFPGQARKLGKRTARGALDGRPRKAATPIATLSLTWDALRARAKLEDFHLHDVRRSFAVTAGDVGISEHIIAGLLGHRVAGVTARYAHRSDPALCDAADRVAAEVAARLNLSGLVDADVLPIAGRGGR